MIRKATKTDAKQLVEIAYLVLAELYEPIAETAMEIAKQKSDLATLIQKKLVPMSYENVTVFEMDEKIIGAVWSYDYATFSTMLDNLYQLEKEGFLIPHLVEEAAINDYYIDTIAVLPQARGKKVAQQLLQTIINEQNEKAIALIVDSKKELPLHLYQKLGFAIDEERQMYGSIYYYMHYRK